MNTLYNLFQSTSGSSGTCLTNTRNALNTAIGTDLAFAVAGANPTAAEVTTFLTALNTRLGAANADVTC